MTAPNVVVFFTDQQRHDTTGVHGNPMGLTPNFDRLARAGTHMYNSFTSQPLCGPARSSMQTGLFATQTGVFRNGIPLADDAETVAKVFARNGYKTAYIGKWHLGGSDPVPRKERGGYQTWLAANLLEFCSDAYDCVLYDTEDNRTKLPGYRVDAITDAAIRYCDVHQSESFFLFVSFLEPHHQNHVDDYPPPEGYRDEMTAKLWTPPDLATLKGTSTWHLGGYYGMVKRLDEAFGRLMDALKSLNMSDNTIVMFTSDHACHFKTRNSEYKRSCHESAVRVPTMITGPGFNAGGQVRALFSAVDVAPTLIDAAGLAVPDGMTGQSIMPVVRDARGAVAPGHLLPDQRDRDRPRPAHASLEIRRDVRIRQGRSALGRLSGGLSLRPRQRSARDGQPGGPHRVSRHRRRTESKTAGLDSGDRRRSHAAGPGRGAAILASVPAQADRPAGLRRRRAPNRTSGGALNWLVLPGGVTCRGGSAF